MNSIKKKLDGVLKLDKLPKEIIISTMTITCKIDNNTNQEFVFDCENIAKYIDLKKDHFLIK